MDQLNAYFRSEYAEQEIDVEHPPVWLKDCLRGTNPLPEWDPDPISGDEVKFQLQRLPSASAPGPDRLPYKVWKVVDPHGDLLSQIFKICQREHPVPSAWKKSTTILLYKKGDEKVPSNWRPISLQNALYKVYAAVWAKRLAVWATEAGTISPSQKGFVPGEGCLEHSFLVRSLMEDARRRRKSLHLVWFDLKNAFGSVPHRLLWFSMESIGLPEDMMSIIKDIYEGSSFVVTSDTEATGEIPQERGVKQGCPLSPLLFNLALEGLLRGIEIASAKGYSFSEDLQVRHTVKRPALGFPGRTCDAFFYTPTSKGGLGLRCIEDDLGNAMITQAVKMLTSPDPLIRGVARHSLDLTIRKRYGETEGPEDRWRFLVGLIKRDRESRRSGDISTVWSRVRDFAREAGVRLHGGTDEDATPTGVTVGGEDLSGDFRRVLLRKLRAMRGASWLSRWTSLAEQGGLPQLSVRCLSPTTGSGTVASSGTESTVSP